jgi:hypothetical protein
MTYKGVDDGMYCRGWWIYDGDERVANAHSEAAAKEICDAVNIIRRLGARLQDIANG